MSLNPLSTAAHRYFQVQRKNLRGNAFVRRTLAGRRLFGGIAGCVAMMGGLWFAGLLSATLAKADSPPMEEVASGDLASPSPKFTLQAVPEPQTWVVASSGL